MIEKVETAWSWIRYVLLALWAVVMGVLMFVYGKRTQDGLMAQVAAHNAKGKLLNAKIEALSTKARQEADERERKRHSERADTLKIQRKEIEEKRLRLMTESGDLVMDDANLAASDNARRARRAAG
ncbi:MAG: hypothetical protein HC828_04065 [Blastochloris sp.]|nr:hypothetical protein [Blastochloris sp.]